MDLAGLCREAAAALGLLDPVPVAGRLAELVPLVGLVVVPLVGSTHAGVVPPPVGLVVVPPVGSTYAGVVPSLVGTFPLGVPPEIPKLEGSLL